MTPEAQHYVTEHLMKKLRESRDKNKDLAYFHLFIKQCRVLGLIDYEMSGRLIEELYKQ